MAAALCLYLLLLLLFGWHTRNQMVRHTNSAFREYLIAGGRQGAIWITFSILASVIGGSAVFGSVDLVAKVGFPAFWWLGVGSAGLLVQAWLLSARVRELQAFTLPHVAFLTMGETARMVISIVICLAWTGVVAGQFVALFQFTAILPGFDTPIARLGIAAVIIMYTAAGGQISVIRTDMVQFLFILCGIGLTCQILYGLENAAPSLWIGRIQFLNERFGANDLARLALLAGAAFFIGPDIMSRNLAAKDGKTARMATFCAAGLLAVFALLMTFVGVWINAHQASVPGTNPLAVLIRNSLPAPAGIVLSLGLISALVSSADTCIMSAAGILEHDILKGKNLRRLRLFVVLFGSLSYSMAILRPDIIGLLLSAYSVYTPGVVIPLFFAIMFHKKRRLNRPFWYLGGLAGGGLGFFGSAAGMSSLPLWGMAAALALSLASLLWSEPAVSAAAPAPITT